MKNSICLLLLAVLFVSLLMVKSASARDYGPYFKVGIGQTDVDTDASTFDDSTSYSLGVGYSLNRNFSVEANYIDLGDAEDDFIPAWTINATIAEACAVAKFPFNPIASGYARFGFFSWDADVHEQGTGLIATDNGNDLTFGLGILFNPDGDISGTIQYQRYGIKLEGVDVDFNNVSFGLQFNF